MFKGSLINDLVLHVTLGQLHLHQQRGVIVAANGVSVAANWVIVAATGFIVAAAVAEELTLNLVSCHPDTLAGCQSIASNPFQLVQPRGVMAAHCVATAVNCTAIAATPRLLSATAVKENVVFAHLCLLLLFTHRRVCLVCTTICSANIIGQNFSSFARHVYVKVMPQNSCA